jgi:hypothetical protein
MTATYDVTTLVGQVRLLAQDSVIVSPGPIFQDEEHAAFLNLMGQNPLLAAASALDVIAASEIYTQKRLKLLDLVTDGVQEGQQLHVIAERYRTMVNEGIGNPAGMFDWAEQVLDEFSERERLLKQLLRLQDGGGV